MKKLFKTKLPILIVILLAIFFRFYGLNWDNGHYLHPDERYMYMTLNDIEWPVNLQQYLDPHNSPLSIAQKGYIYGTAPLFFTKWVADLFDMGVYGEVHIVARTVSALFDLGTLLLVFLTAKKIFNKKAALFAALFYASMVMSIQQSHFFTVDTFLIFFVMLTFYLLNDFIHKKALLSYVWIIFSGISFGLALGSKMSALYFGVVIAGFFLIKLIKEIKELGWVHAIIRSAEYSLLFLFFSYVLFRLTNPYFFENSSWFDLTLSKALAGTLDFNVKASAGKIMYPPSWQWYGKPDFTFLAKNIFFWGAGIPACLMFVVGAALLFKEKIQYLRSKKFTKLLSPESLAVIWVIFLYVYIGIAFVKSLRYIEAMLPLLAIIAGFGLAKLQFKKFHLGLIIQITIVLFALLWPFSFIHIYSQPISRVTASQWIYQNIPANSVITVEHWDDGIPVGLTPDEYTSSGTHYIDFWPKSISMPVYDEDNVAKLEMLYNAVSKADYIVLSSNRARLTIGQLPEKFPYMYQYYQHLDDGSLGYDLVYNGTSFPGLFGFEVNDTKAEEVFSVYDHPEVRIYQRIGNISRDQFNQLLQDGN